jgi:N-acetylglucosamine-6-phosphate deacetylase
VANLPDLGSIEVGKRACYVELNPALEVVQVWYDGKALLN